VTQDGWAALLGYGRATIQRWERGERVPPADAEEAILHLCAARGLFRSYEHGPLAGMTVTPESLRQVFAEARLGLSGNGTESRAAAVSAPQRPSRLPLLNTSFIGRVAELAEVRRLLASTRLLTLTGTGGSGKTRLAIQAAAGLPGGLVDDVSLVELAQISDAALVPQAVTTALGVREAPGRTHQEALTAALANKRTLLILDNCEHLLAACAELVRTLLNACPEVRVLATSRAPLGLAGEIAWRVPPMAVSEPSLHVDGGSAAPLPDAVLLFAERAAAASPGFVLNERAAAVAGQICRTLDGIPLAIELAAARAKVLSVEQIAARLDDRFRLLTGGSRSALPRHQTLRATLDWSHDLLTEAEQTALRRLSVFAGGCTLPAAEAACADNPDDAERLLDEMVTLVDHSLVTVDVQGNEARYRMLETVREYALVKLRDAGEEERRRRAHAAVFLALAEEAEPKLTTPSAREWLARLDAEHDNLRLALAWVHLLPAGNGLRLASALGGYWDLRGMYSEGRAWLTDLLAAERDTARPAVRSRALAAAARLANTQSDYPSASALATEALAIERELDNATGICRSLNVLGMVAWKQGAYEQSEAIFAEGVELAESRGEREAAATLLNNRGALAFERGDNPAARSFFERAREYHRALGDQSRVIGISTNLGLIAQGEGDYNAARAAFTEVLAFRKESGEPLGTANALLNLGLTTYTQGQYPEARELFAEALELYRQLGAKDSIANALNNLGTVHQMEGDLDAARTAFEESLRLRREIGHARGIGQGLHNLGGILRDQGNVALAWDHVIDALARRRALNDTSGTAASLIRIASLVCLAQGYELAARLLGAASALRDSVRSPLAPTDRQDWDQALAQCRAALGDEAFDAAWQSGRFLTLDEAVSEAAQARPAH
jgi:predicted ATPase/Tfp pilus assembly protein PilF